MRARWRLRRLNLCHLSARPWLLNVPFRLSASPKTERWRPTRPTRILSYLKFHETISRGKYRIDFLPSPRFLPSPMILAVRARYDISPSCLILLYSTAFLFSLLGALMFHCLSLYFRVIENEMVEIENPGNLLFSRNPYGDFLVVPRQE